MIITPIKMKRLDSEHIIQLLEVLPSQREQMNGMDDEWIVQVIAFHQDTSGTHMIREAKYSTKQASKAFFDEYVLPKKH